MATHQQSNQRVRHVVCTQTEYDALVSSNAINSAYLYYITDKACLYRGSTKLSFNKEIVSASDLTTISSPKTETLYVSSASKAVGIYHDSAWVILSPGYISTIADNQATANNGKLVTSKAVIDYIATKVRKLTVVNVDDPTTSIQSPVANTIYFSSTTNKSAFWDGTSWLVLHGKHRGFVIVGANVTFTESGLSTAGLLSPDTVYAQPSTKKLGYYDASSNWYLLSDGGSNLTIVSTIGNDTADSAIPNVGAVKDYILSLLYDIGGQYQDDSRTFMVYDGDTSVEADELKKKLNWTFYESAQNLDDYNYTDNGVVEVVKTDGYRDAGLANPVDTEPARIFYNNEFDKPFSHPLVDSVARPADEYAQLTPLYGIDDNIAVATGTLDYSQTDSSSTYAVERRSAPYVPTDVLYAFYRAGYPLTFTFLTTFLSTIDHTFGNIDNLDNNDLYHSNSAAALSGNTNEIYGIHFLNLPLLQSEFVALSTMNNDFLLHRGLLENQHHFIRHPVPKFALNKESGTLCIYTERFSNSVGYKEVSYATSGRILNESLSDRQEAIDGSRIYLNPGSYPAESSISQLSSIVPELNRLGFSLVNHTGLASSSQSVSDGVVKNAIMISVGELYTNDCFCGAVGLNVAYKSGIVDELLVFPGVDTRSSVSCIVFYRRRKINLDVDEYITSLTGGPGICDASPNTASTNINNTNSNIYSNSNYASGAHHSGYLLTSKKKLYGNYTNYYGGATKSWDLIASNVSHLSGFSVSKSTYGPNLMFTPRRALIITSTPGEHPGEDPTLALGTVGYNRYVTTSDYTDINSQTYTRYGRFEVEMMNFKNVITRFKYSTVEPVAIAGSSGIGYHDYQCTVTQDRREWNQWMYENNGAGYHHDYRCNYNTRFGYGVRKVGSLNTEFSADNGDDPDLEPYQTGIGDEFRDSRTFQMVGSIAPSICGGVLFKVTSGSNVEYYPIAIGPIIRVKDSPNGTLMFLTGNALLGRSLCCPNYNDMNGSSTGNCIYKKPVTMTSPDNGEYWEPGQPLYVCNRFIGANVSFYRHQYHSAAESGSIYAYQATDESSFMSRIFFNVINGSGENIHPQYRSQVRHDFYTDDELTLYDYLTLDISESHPEDNAPYYTRTYGTTFYSTEGASDPCVYAPFQIMRQAIEYVNELSVNSNLGPISFNESSYNELRVERFELVAHNNFAIIFSSK